MDMIMISITVLIEIPEVIGCSIIGVHVTDIKQESCYGFCLSEALLVCLGCTLLFSNSSFFPLCVNDGGSRGVSHFDAGVELVDLLPEVVPQLRPLGLQRRGQQAILNRKHLWVQRNVPHLLERLKATLSAQPDDVLKYCILKILAFAQLNVGALDSPLFCPPRQKIRIWNYDAHKTGLKTVSMHKYLGHWVAAGVDVFNLLRSDVLTLGQLKDVLLPINDFQGAIR